MRKIAVVLLLFAHVAQGQGIYNTVFDYTPYIKEAKRIMDILKIGVRKTTSMDGTIRFEVNKDIKGANAFFEGECVFLDSTKTRGFYYKSPSIKVSTVAAETLLGIKKDSANSKLLMESSLVHEFCHYLQSTIPGINYTSNLDSISLGAYIKHPVEFEAYSVGEYYLLEKLHPEVLNEIMGLDADLNEKKKLIITNGYAIATGILIMF